MYFFKKIDELKQEKLKQEKLKQEKLKQEKLKQEKLKQEKIKKEKLKKEKLKKEKLKKEKLKKEKLKQEKLNLTQHNNILYKNVYIISNISGGGSIKYLHDITNNYKNVNFIRIQNKKQLFKIINYKPYDILFVQQLLHTNITPQDIINIKNKFNVKIIISIHDYCWFVDNIYDLNNPPETLYQFKYLNDLIDIEKSVIELFNNASIVIHPSKFTLNQYNRYFTKDNVFLQHHNDINIDYSTKNIPKITDFTINICHFQSFCICKGSENINLLKTKYTSYKGYTIKFFIVGENMGDYDESNWLNILIQYNIHCLLHLNKFGETYSYALSKSINSGLPILYNNVGSFKERIPEGVSHYKKVIDCEKDYANINTLYQQFENMLDYIIENNGLFNTYNNDNTIVYKELYNFLFESKENNLSICNKIYDKIKPFAIYFPQFHAIPENNVNYYNGMTDITNLYKYNLNAVNKLDIPSLTDLKLKTVLDYDLSNKDIINRQIEIAKNNCIRGFAIYYYWFSSNSITNKNTIMEKCHDNFFQEEISDFKVFFVWANENWTGNPAFNTNEKILNEYNVDNFKKNIKNLMRYFKHPNYYKINNKPLFYIHHPFLISDDALSSFETILNLECKNNGFDGCILVLNNLKSNYNNFKNYNFHPNYKKTKTLNYDEYLDIYVNKDNKDNTDTIFFDFNNSARLYNLDKLNLVTVYKNNTINNQEKYIKKILNQYKNKKYDDDDNENNKILLINAWNEWGENMSIEPGQNNGYKYLLLLKSNLISFL
jgi:hypothetical protein